MRKTQVALAALALVASSAAMAEGVTLYGTIDAAVERSSGNGTYMNGAGGFVAGNNFGLKGSEDIGGGLKASFVLQQGFNLRQGGSDNGGGAGFSFNQVAQVSLAGDFGSLTLGQQLSPYIGAIAGGMMGNGNFFVNHIIQASGGNAAGGGANQAGGFFIPNAVTYSTPSIGGFTATLLTSTSADAAAGAAIPSTVASNKYTAGSITGAVGDINLALGFDDRKDTYRNRVLSASTNIAGLGVGASVNSFKPAAGSSYTSWSGSVSYALSDATTVVAQYGKGEVDGTKSSLTSAHVKYALSARTSAYATWGRGTGGASPVYTTRGQTVGGIAGNGPAVDGQTMTAVGIVHSF